jgi:hypothetical protein
LLLFIERNSCGGKNSHGHDDTKRWTNQSAGEKGKARMRKSGKDKQRAYVSRQRVRTHAEKSE